MYRLFPRPDRQPPYLGRALVSAFVTLAALAVLPWAAAHAQADRLAAAASKADLPGPTHYLPLGAPDRPAAPTAEAAEPSEQWKQRAETRANLGAWSVPGKIIVRFDDDVEGCVSVALEQAGARAAEKTDSLGHLVSELKALGITAVDPVHRTADEQARLRAGRHGLPLPELLDHHRLAAETVLGSRQIPREKFADLPALHHVYTLETSAGSDTEALIAALSEHPRVRWAEPLRVHTTQALPNDPFVDPDGDGEWQSGSWGQSHADQWALRNMAWDEVWNDRGALWADAARIGGGGISIAVIDTGVDYGHPDLAPNIWRDAQDRPGIDLVDIDTQVYTDAGYQLIEGEDYTEVDYDPMDRQGHGTHVAGIAAAAANDGIGMAGVAWNADLVPVRAGFVIGVEGFGTFGALENDDIAAAITWAADADVDIINMSFGGDRSLAIEEAIGYAYGLGSLMFASAGNSDTGVGSPASYTLVNSVGATDPSGQKSAFSSWGDDLTLAAPGRDILSTRAAGTLVSREDMLVGEDHIRASGTSMATPQAAGAVALIWSADPTATGSEVLARLLGTARDYPKLLPGREAKLAFGAGTPDLARALTAEAGPHIGLRSVEIELDEPISEIPMGGNTEVLAGDGASLTIRLSNFWRSLDQTRIELTSESSFLLIENSVTFFPDFSNQETLTFQPRLLVAADTPPYLDPDLRIRVSAEGFEQVIDLPLLINGDRSLALVPEGSDERFSTLETTDSVAGRFLAAWTRRDRVLDRYEAVAQFFDESGQPTSERFRLHEEGNEFLHSDVVIDNRSDGSFVAAWRQGRFVDDEYEAVVRFQRFDATGAAIGEPLLIEDPGTTITQKLTIATADSGATVVGWWGILASGYSTPRLQFIDGNGEPVDGVFSITSESGVHSGPSLDFGPEDELLVAWRRYRSNGSGVPASIDVLARRFTADGSAIGSTFRINQETSPWGLNPDVDGDANGWAVAWDWCDLQPRDGGTGLCSMRARNLHADGQFRTDEIVVEPMLDYLIFDVRTARTESGDFATAFDACLNTGFQLFSCEIRAYLHDADGEQIGELHRADSTTVWLEPTLSTVGDRFLLTWTGGGVSPFAYWGRFFLFEAYQDTSPCVADADSLCLQDGRFEVEVQWQDFDGESGVGMAQGLGGTSGYFSFFDPDNVEILVKVLDGRFANDHWWVFYASLSNVSYQMTVRDTETGAVRLYQNPAGTFASDGDTSAFPDADGFAVGPTSGPPTEGLSTRAHSTGAHSTKERVLDLHSGRFQVEVSWTDFDGGNGQGEAVPLTDDSGAFWFFDAANVELVVKVLDGRPINGKWWVYYGSMSNVAYSIRITDTETGTVREYQNPLGSFASRGDVQAF